MEFETKELIALYRLCCGEEKDENGPKVESIYCFDDFLLLIRIHHIVIVAADVIVGGFRFPFFFFF